MVINQNLDSKYVHPKEGNESCDILGKCFTKKTCDKTIGRMDNKLYVLPGYWTLVTEDMNNLLVLIIVGLFVSVFMLGDVICSTTY